MRAKAQITLIVSTDTDQYQLLFSKTKDSLNTLIRDDCNTHNSGVVRLAAAGDPPVGTPFTLPMGDVATGKILYISTDKKITIKLDGSITEFEISPSGAYPGQLFWHGSFTTAPVIENQADDVCTVEFCIVGVEA